MVLVAFLIWTIIGEAVRTGGLADTALDDYAIARSRAAQVIERVGYAWQLAGEGRAVVFAYPPPYALFHGALSAAGSEGGPVLFMLAIAAACVSGLRVCMRLMGVDRRPFRWLAACLAVLACRPFVQADLHFLNSNSLTLALALGALAAFGAKPRRLPHEALGGLLLACSIAIKPWAAGVVGALIVLRRGSALAWSFAGLALVFGAVPALALGPTAALDLSVDWFRMAFTMMGLDATQRIAVDNVSLSAGLQAIGISGPVLALWVRGFQGIWVLGLASLLWPSLRRAAEGRALVGRSGFRIGATLLVMLVPLTSIFQPHHAVVVVPLALLVAIDALAPRVQPGSRAVRLGALASVFFLASYGPGGPIRGLIFPACFVILVSTAWLPVPRPRPPRVLDGIPPSQTIVVAMESAR